MKFLRRFGQPLLLAVLVGASVFVWFKQQYIADWFRLRNYQPATAVAQLASQTTMTQVAKHLFYVNHPIVSDRVAFNQQCTNKSEQSVVLGCYHGNRQGIFIFNVTQPELNGVEQVTAAHEMLHQAYDRLSKSERQRINGLLQDYFDHGLQDQAIKDQMAGYQKSEPGEMLNEMHSVFGTEVSSLPAPLEQYYKQYFSARSTVAAYYQSYQAAFTQRNQQIAEYDTQLASQKQTINNLQASLSGQAETIATEKAQMDQKKASGDISGFNAMVPGFNQLVDTYNSRLETLRSQIDGYNTLVAARNAIAIQEQELQKDLSSQSLPSETGQ